MHSKIFIMSSARKKKKSIRFIYGTSWSISNHNIGQLYADNNYIAYYAHPRCYLAENTCQKNCRRQRQTLTYS